MASASPILSPEVITPQVKFRAAQLAAQARRDAAELTNPSDPMKYEPIRGPLGECADLLEAIAQQLNTEPAKEPRE